MNELHLQIARTVLARVSTDADKLVRRMLSQSARTQLLRAFGVRAMPFFDLYLDLRRVMEGRTFQRTVIRNLLRLGSGMRPE